MATLVGLFSLIVTCSSTNFVTCSTICQIWKWRFLPY